MSNLRHQNGLGPFLVRPPPPNPPPPPPDPLPPPGGVTVPAPPVATAVGVFPPNTTNGLFGELRNALIARKYSVSPGKCRNAPRLGPLSITVGFGNAGFVSYSMK